MSVDKAKRRGWVVGLAAAVLAGVALAHEGHEAAGDGKDGKAAGKAATVTGEVIDVACYVAHAGRGADHKECATKCVTGGMPVGILTDKGEVILAVTDDHTAANTLLAPLLATKVKAEGELSSRGGVKVLAIAKVEPVAAPAGKAAAAPAAAAPVQTAAKEGWVCPMGCSKADKPGKCPVCGMDLVKQKT